MESMDTEPVSEDNVDQGDATNTEKSSDLPTTNALSSSSKESSKQRYKGDNSNSSVKTEDQGDCQGLGSELGVTPTLLDEVLDSKKMGLMRSPEVMKFLQAQQARLATEKRILNSPSKREKTEKS